MDPTVGHVLRARLANTGNEAQIIRHASSVMLENIWIPWPTMQLAIASIALLASTHQGLECRRRTRAGIVLQANFPNLMVQRMLRPVLRALPAPTQRPQVLLHAKTVQLEHIQSAPEGLRRALA